MDYKKRRAQVVDWLERKKIPLLLLKSSSNIFYLTGIQNLQAFLAVSVRGETALFVHAMYYHEALDGRYGGDDSLDIRLYEPAAFRRFLKGFRKTAFIDTEFTYAASSRLQKSGDLTLTPVPDFLLDFRMVKDAFETRLIKKALGVNKKVFREIAGRVMPGRTECEVAGEIHYLIGKHGGSGSAFSPIVASGLNSVYPHHKSRNVPIEKNSPVMIDAGVDFQGYKSDLTRTFFAGNSPEKKLKDIYKVLKDTQHKTIEYIKPGLSGKEIHNYALNILKENGLHEYFIHGLGHGVGIDVHEKPYLNSSSTDIISPGCVLTVEPGVYIPNLGGVRLEEMVFPE